MRATHRFSHTGKWEGPVTPGRIGASVLRGVEPSHYDRVRAPALAVYVPWDSPVLLWPRYESFDAADRLVADRFFAAVAPRLRAVQERFRSQVEKGRVLTIAGGRHAIHLSHPDEVERAIRDFLQRVVGDG